MKDLRQFGKRDLAYNVLNNPAIMYYNETSRFYTLINDTYQYRKDQMDVLKNTLKVVKHFEIDKTMADSEKWIVKDILCDKK